MNKIKWRELLVEGIEWFARLAVLNVCWLLFSLALVTFIPASSAGYTVLRMWSVGEALDQPVFPLFKDQFVKRFKESYRLGFPFLIVGLILGMNLTFFFMVDDQSSVFLILKYATVLLTVFYIFFFSYSFALSTLFDAKVLTLLKISFIIMFSQPQRLVMLFFYWLLAMIIFTFFPALLFFFSITGLAYQFLKTTKAGYYKLLATQEEQ